MKKLFLLLAVPFIANCQSNEVSPSIMGDWLLEQSYYQGCFGGSRATYTLNDGLVVQFSAPNKYREMKRDTLLSEGTFELVPKALPGHKEGVLVLTLSRTFVRSKNSGGYVVPVESILNEVPGTTMSISDLGYSTTSSGSTYRRLR